MSIINFEDFCLEENIEVSIRDEGPGINKEELPKIFDKFYQTKVSKLEKHKGTGLGLSIAKTIIEANKGKIWAKSVPGKGSTFYFTIPKKKS